MDSLDFNLHQLVLSELAGSVKAGESDPSSEKAVEAIASRVKTRDLTALDVDDSDERFYMVRF